MTDGVNETKFPVTKGALGYQENVNAPVAIMLTELPAHTEPVRLTATTLVGVEANITFVVLVPTQPSVDVPIAVYTVVAVIEMTAEEPVVLDGSQV